MQKKYKKAETNGFRLFVEEKCLSDKYFDGLFVADAD